MIAPQFEQNETYAGAIEVMELADQVQGVGSSCVFAIVGHDTWMVTLASRAIEGSLHSALFAVNLPDLNVFLGPKATVLHGKVVHFVQEDGKVVHC